VISLSLHFIFITYPLQALDLFDSKVKVTSYYRPWRPLRENRGIALLFFVNLGTRWGWVVNTTPRPHLPPGKTRYSLYRRLGGLRSRSGRVRKISHPPGFDPRTFQPVASRYTDYAIPAAYLFNKNSNSNNNNNNNNNNSIQFSRCLLTFWFNSTNANYKASTRTKMLHKTNQIHKNER
jgi:hypothetical protein